MIKLKIVRFLREELKLTLSESKTKLTNLHKDKTEFLGFYIRINKPKENKRVVANIKGTRRKVKVGHNTMMTLAPVSNLLDKLIKGGFVRIGKNPKKKYIPIAKTP